MADEYVFVPVAAARAIAEQYNKSIVIVYAWDAIYGLLHTTTYGTDEQNRAWAASAGEIGIKALGCLPEHHMFEDYRLDRIKELEAEVQRLKGSRSGEGHQPGHDMSAEKTDTQLLEDYWAAHAQFGPFDVGPEEFVRQCRESEKKRGLDAPEEAG